MDNYTITSTDVPKTYTQEEYDKALAQMLDAEKRYQALYNSWSRVQTQIDNVRNILIQKMKDQEIDEDVAREIADALDLSLMQTYDVTITVTFSGSVEVPLGFDMDCLEDSLSASLDISYYGQSDISLDVSEDGMEIDYHESYY